MTDDAFNKLAMLYGFAPSRALRELVEAVERMEREACAKVCDGWTHADGDTCADAIRARKENT